ncbi:MAG TPA: trypsin-like peptidase domain-containing protein [Clostridia bacterium]
MNDYLNEHDNDTTKNEVTIIPEGTDNYAYIEEKKKKKSNFKTYVSLVIAASVLSSSVVGGALYLKFTDELKKQSSLINKPGITSNLSKTTLDTLRADNIIKTALPQGSSVTQIAKKVSPSIVGIRMTVIDPRFDFFGQEEEQSQAEGSGIIISEDGYIMTNYHVVSYADPKGGSSKNTTLEVFLPDKRQVKAKFIGGDSINDLAVIKVDLNNLPVAELGDSSKLEVGELAVAIGNPLGMEFAGSVTVGVISALNRQVDAENTAMNMIQTDAAINPGNSGGALVNSQGQIIGINSIKISKTGVEGLGFAIPTNVAKPIVDQLIMFGYVKGRPAIGISGKEVTETLAQIYGLPVGIYITNVAYGSGAEKAGIKRGDILLSIAGKEVKTMKDLDTIKKSYKAGDSVKAVIYGDDGKKTVTLIFDEEK